MTRKSNTNVPNALTVVAVTPAQAKEWLDTRYENERTIRKSKLQAFVRDMLNGNWHFIGDTIRFDHNGALVDGQHRLASVIESDTTQWFPVLNIPAEAHAAIDSGTARTLGDLLQFGNHVHGRTLAAITRRLLIHRDGRQGTTEGGSYQPSMAEGVEFVAKHKEQLHRAVEWGLTAARNKLPIPASVVGAVYFLAEGKDPELAEDFFRKLTTGMEIHKGEPVAALRDRAHGELARNRRAMATDDAFRFTIMTWNATRSGRQITRLNMPKGGWRKKQPPVVE